MRQRRDFAAPGRSGHTRPLPARARAPESRSRRWRVVWRRSVARIALPASQSRKASRAGDLGRDPVPGSRRRRSARWSPRTCARWSASVRRGACARAAAAGLRRRAEAQRELAAIALPSQCKNNALAPSAVTLAPCAAASFPHRQVERRPAGRSRHRRRAARQDQALPGRGGEGVAGVIASLRWN